MTSTEYPLDYTEGPQADTAVSVIDRSDPLSDTRDHLSNTGGHLADREDPLRPTKEIIWIQETLWAIQEAGPLADTSGPLADVGGGRSSGLFDQHSRPSDRYRGRSGKAGGYTISDSGIIWQIQETLWSRA